MDVRKIVEVSTKVVIISEVWHKFENARESLSMCFSGLCDFVSVFQWFWM